MYDYYLRSLLEGRFDVPIRVVSFEGHLDPEGKAFVYHSLLPLVPRAILAPFVDLQVINAKRWVVFGFAAAAIAILQYKTFSILLHVSEPSRERTRWIVLTAVMCWAATAGPMVVSNSSLYNETFATVLLAVTMAGYIFSRLIVFDDPIDKWLVVFAVCIVIALHSRITIALGLCLTFGTLWLYSMFRTRFTQMRPLIFSALICCLGMGVLLFSNHARFGDVTRMHGTFDAERVDEVQHAVVYWNIWEKRERDYRTSFVKHGTFNSARVLPNTMMYFAGLPAKAASQVELYHSMIGDYGEPRIWGPYGGILFLWMPWIVLLFYALKGRKNVSNAVRPDMFVIATLGGFATACLILTFASMHFRYRVDLWPLVSILSIASLAVLFHRSQSVRLRQRAFWVMSIATFFALAFSAHSVRRHAEMNHDSSYYKEHALFAFWSEELCLEMVEERGFSVEKHEDLCDLT